MKQLLQQYSAYNLWTNQKISEAIKTLSDEKINAEIISSFPSIQKTLSHMLDAESIWWQRVRLAEHVEVPSVKFERNTDELIKELLRASQQWNEWVHEANDANLTHVIAYYNSKKEHFKQAVNEILIHLFNHQTYHRGQIVTMLRQLGVDKIPSTDFIVFMRKK